MVTLNELLSIKSTSSKQLLGVELRKNDYRLLRDLIRIRKELDVSQDALAVRMGVSQPTVSAFERLEADPKLSTIRRYAKELGLIIHHSVEVAGEAVTSDSSANFTRARWNANPRMAFTANSNHLGHFLMSAPREAYRTDFALGA